MHGGRKITARISDQLGLHTQSSCQKKEKEKGKGRKKRGKEERGEEGKEGEERAGPDFRMGL